MEKCVGKMRNGEKQIQKEGEEANVTQTKKKKKRGKKKTGKRNKKMRKREERK